MASPNRLVIVCKALCQLGVQPVVLNALYRFGLVTGYYQRITGKPAAAGGGQLKAVLPVPKQDDLLAILGRDGLEQLLTEADEIIVGKIRLFGAEPVPLQLSVPVELADWTAYETGKVPLPINQLPISDIKFIWEPARFGWTFTLGRAYHACKEDKYAEAFWRYFETFTDANPPCFGPHWMSGQEVALRLMAFVWAAQVFEAAPDSTPERKSRLAASVAAHAARIPPTLVYARSQQNNHLLTEAAGLLTAGLALPDHPDASRWSGLGWKWLNAGLRSQIDGYGEYTQHSANYQRMMLQVALWADALIHNADSPEYTSGKIRPTRWPRETTDAVGRATHWLLALLDPASGRTPNLGANDGAYIFPLTICPFDDYRPVLHSAARAFLNYDLPHGPWDEMSLWFGIPFESKKYVQLPRYLGDQIYGKDSWAFLRTAQFSSRPSHADQLHLDLWWRGLNIARDAGTYLYNASPPWDNHLTIAQVHNTVTLNGRDQFTRAGRFLYLDWFDAYRKNTLGTGGNILQSSSAHYHAYRRPGIRHTRTVTALADERWKIEDEFLVMPSFILPYNQRPLQDRSSRKRPILNLAWLRAIPPLFRLHWLLPDWEWEIIHLPEEMQAAGCDLRLRSPHGWLTIRISTDLYTTQTFEDTFTSGLVRAGETLHGNVEPSPFEGWFSPTYGVKVPALSLSMTLAIPGSGSFETEFIFPK
jgi:hypothetical protein